MRKFGVRVYGVRMPVIKSGDQLETLVFNEVTAALASEHITIQDGDVIGITESIVARAQNNYAPIRAIAKDVRTKLGNGPIGLVFPILSRNRFLSLLEGIINGVDRLIIQLSYPQDEVGNQITTLDDIDAHHVNPYFDTFSDDDFRQLFGPELLHPFTHCDYPKMYKDLSDKVTIIYANNPREILKYTSKVIAGDIHSRKRTKRILREAGAEIVIGLDDILNHPIDGSGYNADYGILGSNFASQGVIKLFPRDAQNLVESIQLKFLQVFQKKIEVLVYGDGAFKDPVGHIWELADPVVAPFYTSGLSGTPQELKFKMLADTKFANRTADEAQSLIREEIRHNKTKERKEQALGTTPRRLTDLIGSLCDLTSGSGDKGTPVVYIQGYFDNYSDQ
jgi:hypothetical protein